jgi:hypothetical protein
LTADAVEHDDQVTKVRFRLPDGPAIETVHLRYRAGWTSLCISSQAGCGLGCTFCATASLGLRRNLRADEITDQVLWFRQRGEHVGRVAFMGMGEPLANPHVIEAIDVLVDPALFAYGPRRITVSTVGMLHSPPSGQRAAVRRPCVPSTGVGHRRACRAQACKFGGDGRGNARTTVRALPLLVFAGLAGLAFVQSFAALCEVAATSGAVEHRLAWITPLISMAPSSRPLPSLGRERWMAGTTGLRCWSSRPSVRSRSARTCSAPNQRGWPAASPASHP